jgi:hypothetical protein
LAAFFSFGDSKACFFTSRLDRWDLGMMFTPDYIAGTPAEGFETELQGVCPGIPISPALLCALTYR